MKIAFYSTQPYDRLYFERHNKIGAEITFLEAQLSSKTVSLARDHTAICAFVNDNLDKEVISKLAEFGIKLIVLRCAGFNNVDISAAKSNSIKVVRVPEYSPYSVAEHAVALILSLNRKIHKAYNRVRENNFSLDRLIGFDLHGKTVGVIGTGKIGSIFCKIMQGFGCKVLAYDVYENDSLKEAGVKYLPLEQLLGESHIISLHCPLSKDTKNIINSDTIQKMKDGVMLINTSRGALVDTKAVIHALKKNKIGYLGLDVYENEQAMFFYDHSEKVLDDEVLSRLITFPNVLITSHQAFFTEEALTKIAEVSYQNIVAFEKGEKCDNVVE